MRLATPAISSKQGFSKKLIIGVVALVSAAIIGTVGIASATPDSHNMPGYDPSGTSVNTNVNVNADAQVDGNGNVVQFVVNVYNTINIFN